MKKLMMAVMVAALGLSAAAAFTPSFAYQGVLRDEYGNPTGNENVLITFKVYKSDKGTDYLWSKDINVGLDTNGLFNVELSGEGLDSTAAHTTLDKVAADNSNEDLYIGLTVSGSAGEISPRQKLLPTPRALFAHNVKKADGDFTVNGNLTVAGAISMSDANSQLSASSIWATGDLYANGATTLNGGAQVGGELTVSGNATIGSANTVTKIKGDTAINGTLSVSNAPLTVAGVQMSMPIGAIIMWAGTQYNIPDGWQLCDGSRWTGDEDKYVGPNSSNKTVPDLRGRFVVGTVDESGVSVEGRSYKSHDKGGADTVALSYDQMPQHNHSMTFTGYQTDCEDGANAYYPYPTSKNKTAGSPASVSVGTTNAGSGAAHENRPPYYALCYIIKVK